MNMKKNILFTVLLLPFVFNAAASELAPYEMPRTHVAPIKDRSSNGQYELYIKLPEDYAENTSMSYPVIYTTDAAWHMDMLSGSTEYLMPNVILVGISWQKGLDDERAHVSRFKDYTVVEYENPEIQAQFQGGHASHHLDFIRSEVFEYIDANYRADPDERTYFGFSLGGAFGAYILLAQPDTFNHYILGSPAFGQRSLQYVIDLEAETALEQKHNDVDVFVTIGELEESEMENIERLASALQRRSQSGLALTGIEVIEDSDHSAAFPETAIRGVRWLSKLTDNLSRQHNVED